MVRFVIRRRRRDLWVAGRVCNSPACQFWLLSKLIDAGFMDILSTFIPSVFSAGLMGLALWLTLAYNKFAAAYAVSIGALLAVFIFYGFDVHRQALSG